MTIIVRRAIVEKGKNVFLESSSFVQDYNAKIMNAFTFMIIFHE